jgi:hypothetical protein
MFKGPETDVNLHVLLSDTGCGPTQAIASCMFDWKYTQNYADAKTAVIEETISRGPMTGF